MGCVNQLSKNALVHSSSFSAVARSGRSTLPTQIWPLSQTLKYGARNNLVLSFGRAAPLIAQTNHLRAVVTQNTSPGWLTTSERSPATSWSSGHRNQIRRMPGGTHHAIAAESWKINLSGMKPPSCRFIKLRARRSTANPVIGRPGKIVAPPPWFAAMSCTVAKLPPPLLA